MVTLEADCQADPRRVRSRMTPMAWLRLRALVMVGTLTEISDGFSKDVVVIDAPDTLPVAIEVDLKLERTSEGEDSGVPSW